MSPLRVVPVLSLSLLGGASLGYTQDPLSEFLETYQKHEPTLIEQYLQNRKAKVKATGYEVKPCHPNKGAMTGYTISEIIHDNNRSRSQRIEFSDERYRDNWLFWTPEYSFGIVKKEGSFLVVSFLLRSKNAYSHDLARASHSLLTIPLRFGGERVFTSSFLSHTTAKLEILSVGKSIFKGKPAIVVECLEPDVNPSHQIFQRKSKAYFDPDNHYAALGKELDLAESFGLEFVHKSRTEIEYQPSREGFPHPKVFRRVVEYPDGSSQVMQEIEFLSLERYVPEPEEFLLEERFGLSTPTAEGVGPSLVFEKNELPLAPKNNWYWWVLLMGLLLWGIVFWYRRLRGGVSSPPTPR